MKAADLFVLFFSGLAFFSALGVLMARRMVMMALSLGLFFLAVAGIFASLGLEAAFFTQLVLYIGGVMVLVGISLQLYPEPAGVIPLRKIRESFGKGLILFTITLICLFLAPWESLKIWHSSLKPDAVLNHDYSLKSAGRHLLLEFPFEFEWIGFLMLAGLLVSGWFLKDLLHSEKK